MSAADDYPNLSELSLLGPREALGRRELAAALAEIDRLREANRLLNEIVDDVLPVVVITERSIFRIDGQWMLVTPDPKDLT